MLATIIGILDAFKDQLQPAMDAAGEDPVERFTAGYRRYCHIVAENLDAVALTYRESRTLEHRRAERRPAEEPAHHPRSTQVPEELSPPGGMVRGDSALVEEMDAGLCARRLQAFVSGPQLGAGYQSHRSHQVNVDRTQPAPPKLALAGDVQDFVVPNCRKLVEIGEQTEHLVALPDGPECDLLDHQRVTADPIQSAVSTRIIQLIVAVVDSMWRKYQYPRDRRAAGRSRRG